VFVNRNYTARRHYRAVLSGALFQSSGYGLKLTEKSLTNSINANGFVSYSGNTKHELDAKKFLVLSRFAVLEKLTIS
jgi:hypothetical protein